MANRRLPAAERKRQIAQTALAILGERDARRLTAVELARVVGVTDATLFRHFGSMKEIVDAAIALLEQQLDPPPPSSDTDPLDRLGAFVVFRLEQWQERPELLRLLTGDRLIDAAGAAGAERVRALRQRSERYVMDCLRQAQRQGLVGRDLSPLVLAWMVRGVIHGASLSFFPQRRSSSSRRHEADRAPKATKIWHTLRAMLARSVQRG